MQYKIKKVKRKVGGKKRKDGTRSYSGYIQMSKEDVDHSFLVINQEYEELIKKIRKKVLESE